MKKSCSTQLRGGHDARSGEFSRWSCHMRIPRICSLLALVVTSASLGYGQGVATGDLHVILTDPQGQPVANASVSARDQSKGTERVASGNGQGEYSILALPPSRYNAIVNAQGFGKQTSDVVITAGASAELAIKVQLREASESVKASSAA